MLLVVPYLDISKKLQHFHNRKDSHQAAPIIPNIASPTEIHKTEIVRKELGELELYEVCIYTTQKAIYLCYHERNFLKRNNKKTFLCR